MVTKKGDAVIQGTVTGPDGGPLKGVTVSARRVEDPAPAGTDTTGDDGRYRISDLKPRERYVLSVEVDGGHQEVRQVTARKGDQTVDISLPTQGDPMSDTTTTTSDSTTTTASSTTTAPSTTTIDPSATTSSTTSDSTTTTSDSSTTVSASTTASDSSTTTVAPSGGGASFGDLIDLVEDPKFSPEPAVNIDEAKELARLWVLAMYELAGIPNAIDRLFTTRGANYAAGDLTLERMDQLPAAVTDRMQEVIRLRTEQFDTEENLLAEMRSAFNLGTAAVPSVNGEFAALYRRLVALAADDNNGADPDEVKKDDLREAHVIYNFLRELKRAMLRLTQNMSVAGTLGTRRLSDKWTDIMAGSIWILGQVGANNVVSSDQDDKAPWSLLAALTDTPRGTVKTYVVNARDGGHMLRLAVELYDAVQSGNVNGGGGLDDESDEFVRKLFFAKAKDLFVANADPSVVKKVGDRTASEALKQPGTLVRDYVATLWP